MSRWTVFPEPGSRLGDLSAVQITWKNLPGHTRLHLLMYDEEVRDTQEMVILTREAPGEERTHHILFTPRGERNTYGWADTAGALVRGRWESRLLLTVTDSEVDYIFAWQVGGLREQIR